MAKVDFWFKKDEKCRMKMKNIRPTPKSMTHRNPTYMSLSDKRNSVPREIRYIPAV